MLFVTIETLHWKVILSNFNTTFYDVLKSSNMLKDNFEILYSENKLGHNWIYVSINAH